MMVEMEGRSNRPGSEVMSSNPTTLKIENSNIAEGACLTTENTSDRRGWPLSSTLQFADMSCS